MSEIIRIGTFNIQSSDCKVDIANEVIAKSRVDVLGVQEVRNKRVIDFVKDYTNDHLLYGSFFENLKISDGTDYGNGLLSHYPFQTINGKKYDFCIAEQRSFIHAKIYLNDRPVSIYTTHLEVEEKQRIEEIQELFDTIQTDDTEFKIIVGDMNVANYKEEFAAFISAGYTSAQGESGQLLTTYEDESLDHIFVTPNIEIIDVGVFNHEGASDHQLLYADIRFK